MYVCINHFVMLWTHLSLVHLLLLYLMFVLHGMGVSDNPKVSETMRDIVDGSIELVLRDNGKATIPEDGQMPLDFSLIYIENDFDITAK
jgi:hypothetical protein